MYRRIIGNYCGHFLFNKCSPMDRNFNLHRNGFKF